MDIKAEEISEIIRDRLATPLMSMRPVPSSARRRHRARPWHRARGMSGEMLEFTHGVFGIALISKKRAWARCCWATTRKSRKATWSTHRLHHLGAGRQMPAASSTRWAAHRRQGPCHLEAILPNQRIAPGVADRQGVKETAADRSKAIDAMVPIGRDSAVSSSATARREDGVAPTPSESSETGVVYNAIGRAVDDRAGRANAESRRDAPHDRCRSRADPAPLLYISPFRVLDWRVFRSGFCNHHLMTILSTQAIAKFPVATSPGAGTRRCVLSAPAPARKAAVEQRAAAAASRRS